MIWMAIIRGGTVLSLVAAALQIYDLHVREIKPNRIYSTAEAARYLGIGRRAVVKLIRDGELRGKMVAGNYRIPGQSMLDYLKQ